MPNHKHEVPFYVQRDEHLHNKCKKLAPFVGENKATALWLSYVTSETTKAKLEAETFIELFWLRFAGGNVSENQIYLPPDQNHNSGSIPFGEVYFGPKHMGNLTLSPENIVKHIGLFSITGGGKTNACKLLLQSLINYCPFLVIDWKRSYRDISRKTNGRVRIESIGQSDRENLRWNPLQPPPGISPQTWIAIVAEALEKSHLSGPGTADIFIEVFDNLFSKLGWYKNTGKPNRLPTFQQAFFEVLSQPLKGRRMLWRDTCVRILRTFTMGPAAKSFNAVDPISFETLLTQPTILEIDYELPKPVRVFVSEIILRWIHLYRLKQGESAHLKHTLILEEAHNVLPNVKGADHQIHNLETLLREIRSFGQGLIIISQHPSLLPTYVLGNTNTLVFLGLQHEDDIRAAAKALFLKKEEMEYLDALNVGEAIVKIKGRGGPYYVRFPKIK